MKKSVVIFLNIIYWMMYLWILVFVIRAIHASFCESYHGPGKCHFPGWIWWNIFASSGLIPAFLGFYSSYAFLFPRFLKRKKLLSFFLSGVLVYIASALIQDIYLSVVPRPGIFVEQRSAIAITIMLTLIALINGIMGLVMRGFITSYGDIKLKADLNQKNHEMELALVKSQINPHFLFNTINNIDVLITKDATKASSYLNKLSDIMRFMLYETKAEKIPLEQELAYIEKYIDLQKIRTSNPNYVSYSVKGDASNLMIAPMLFIPFIENAFKHAENKMIENAINIAIIIEKDKITFDCENSYSSNTQTKLNHSGLGNELIQKRLILLYPNKHKLKVADENNTYKVKLTLGEN
jgi:two-component system, LytTR family, sensor kinase